MKTIISITAALALSAGAALAGATIASKNPAPTKNPVCVVDDSCFSAGEVNFDIIGMYIDPTGDTLGDGVGGGIGLGYFFSENFGVNTKAYWWDGDDAVHSITASAVYRAPIEDTCLAPYLYGGIGGHFDSVNQVSGHLGAGLEYRLTESVGLFADYSHTWADTTDNWHGYTLGLRFIF